MTKGEKLYQHSYKSAFPNFSSFNSFFSNISCNLGKWQQFMSAYVLFKKSQIADEAYDNTFRFDEV